MSIFDKLRGDAEQQEPQQQSMSVGYMRDKLTKVKRTKKTRAQILDSIKPVVSAPTSGSYDITDASIALPYNYTQNIADVHLEYFGNQSFIGYQSCATLAQNPMITIACNDPVDDALRKGWQLTKNDDEELKPLQLKKIQKLDKTLNIKQKIHNFAYFGRVFGVRVAAFIVDGKGDDYYENPFNPDSVTKGSYRGVIMPDPQWCIPLVTQESLDPNSDRFYMPTYWQIGSRRYHWTHCVEYIHVNVPQILKPSYLYGGISLVQEIYQAVYNASITTNEIPQLIQTMRQQVMHIDLKAALADQATFEQRMATIIQYQDNYGLRMLDSEEALEFMQTSVQNLDDVTLFLYKLVASIARMPISKFLKTDLTGGLSKGDGEEAIYHETLESIQAKMQPFLDRHYLMSSLSLFGKDLDIDARFNKLDAMTQEEALAIEQAKQGIDAGYIANGVFDSEAARLRVLADRDSIYSGLGLENKKIKVQSDGKENNTDKQ